MGNRTGTETVAGIIAAFWRDRTWSQATLARELGLTVRSVRKHLDELVVLGWPLEREEDHPHVYWSVPQDWFPGGVFFDAADLSALLHLLVRVPAGPERSRLLHALSRRAPKLVSSEIDRVLPPETSEVEEELLPRVLDAVSQRTPLQLRYFTASRGTLSERTVSIQRVLTGPPARFVAYCHAAKDLRWFRLDYVASLREGPSPTFVDVDDEQVDGFLQKSVDGFYAAEAKRVAFFVREPESRWVAKNLPDGLDGVDVDGGFLVDCQTNGLLPAARFVVGLGAAAECRSDELKEEVRRLARGALGKD